MSQLFSSRYFAAFFVVALLFQRVAPCQADASADQARALFDAGKAASRQDRWSEAEELFARSRTLVEKPSTLLNLAIAQVNVGRGREALASLDRLETIADPVIHAALLERGRALRPEAKAVAISTAERELVLVSLEGEAEEQLRASVSAFAEGRYTDARAGFERVRSLSKRPELFYDVGLCAERLHDDAHAIAAFADFLAALPDHPRAPGVATRLAELRRATGVTEHGISLPDRQSRPEAPGNGAISDAPEPPHPIPPAPKRRYLLAYSLFAAGVVAGGGAWGAAKWWRDRRSAQELCDDSGDRCTNGDQIGRQRRTALSMGVLLTASAVGMVTAGVVLRFGRRAPTGLQTWLRVAPTGLTLGLDHL